MHASAAARADKEATGRHDEHELLLACATTRADAERVAHVRSLLGRELDWSYLLQAAKRHAVLPLFARQLEKNAPAGSVPAAHLQTLRHSFRDNAARNLYLTGELLRILRIFDGQGIEAVPYKGPALAVSAYGDLTLRRFIDLDIMVRKRDVMRAKELLLADGYQPQTPLTRTQESAILRTQHNLAFTRERGRLVVELHWDIAPNRFSASLDAEQLWTRLVPLSLNGVEIKSLKPEDLLLSLCVHGSKHLWERLAWVCDVSELVAAHPALDWEWLLDLARRTGNERMLYLGLRLASELLAAPLPRPVRERIDADDAIRQLSAGIAARLFDESGYRSPGLLENIKFNLHVRRRWRDKARYLQFVLAPTDGDFAALSLPSSLTFVYYFLRPFRLLFKGEVEH